jgi:hypothetical protein
MLRVALALHTSVMVARPVLICMAIDPDVLFCDSLSMETVNAGATRVTKFDGFYQNSLKIGGFGPHRIKKSPRFIVHDFKISKNGTKNQDKYYKKLEQILRGLMKLIFQISTV